ncbi:penicillin-insensitive murein endopeptidase [Youhaiella tibetensis]|uniref:Penicillin-insensitive murein endopeptidase n=1 Tax=Paradevosia tibetensis TaxID=1447062 RepID=A0A5B9DU05_9HYPH|nr:penicillin-insensitive murein endopeptidase [Youhaiella tibetensis]QEE21814.1 penicillin-insensitive murein endopeptidase [Youhaiella tibetensis]GGF48030.1 penicillin-insensitive murein endopeptidase [Youhaiella tibetensis]
MNLPRLLGFASIALCLLLTSANAQQPARDLFGAMSQPTGGPSIPVGSYAKGCIAGAVQLPTDGPGWQAMRLSRDRRWGTPELVGYIEALAGSAAQDGWPGIMVGDMGQARGGPMKSGHASHQIGLDVDIWLQPMPNHTLSAEEREKLSAVSVLRKGTREVDPKRFGEAERLLIYRAAQLPGVARIFVAPGIKKSLCAITWRDRSFLHKIRPWYGHDDHFHVRLSCPPGVASCLDQNPIPAGDGCGGELDYWFTDAPYKPSTSPPAPPLTLADLPKACAAVLKAH